MLFRSVAGGVVFAGLSAGYIHACGRTAAGVAYCWGWSQYGQVGDGTTGPVRLTPTAVAGGLLFASLSAGDSQFSCGRTAAGTAYCWGWNQYGQLGDGTTTNRAVPTLVKP